MNLQRLQRLRANTRIRNLCAETEFQIEQLIQPLFAVQGLAKDEVIQGLRGVHRQGLDSLLQQIEKDLQKGVRHFILFPVPEQKSKAQVDLSFAKSAITAIKKRFAEEIFLWVDTCLCSSTTHGHCCIFNAKQQIDSEATLSELARMALAYAQAGADGISPSDMMDGRVGRIRETLDANEFTQIPVMSYSTKFASAFYGPFRNAANSSPQFGDRKQYQIDVRNRTDALNSSIRCAKEGADLLMVKPGMSSIDLIAPIQQATGLQVGAYQVSGEYAGLHYLAENGLLDFHGALFESWQVFKRAGAQFIITYGARYFHECRR